MPERNLFEFLPKNFGEVVLSLAVAVVLATVVGLIGIFIQFSVPHSIALTVVAVLLIPLSALLLGSAVRHRLDPIINIPSEVQRVLEERLPDTRFVDGIQETLDAMLMVVRGASISISATGGRSRKDAYLREIEAKVLGNKDLVYHRIVFGRKMTTVLCSHLCRLLDDSQTRRRVRVAWIRQGDLGYFTVTDAGVIIFMPDPHDPTRDIARCLHVSSRQRDGSQPRMIEALDRWITYLWGEATEKLDTSSKVRNYCKNSDDQGSHREHP